MKVCCCFFIFLFHYFKLFITKMLKIETRPAAINWRNHIFNVSAGRSFVFSGLHSGNKKKLYYITEKKETTCLTLNIFEMFLQDADFLTDSLFNWQLVVWCLCIWTYMLRFMTIGFRINKKYRNCMSMVITEQINLYLQMEQHPEKKDELTVVNNVLKLASDLLKVIFLKILFGFKKF